MCVCLFKRFRKARGLCKEGVCVFANAVRVKNTSPHALPAYATKGAAGVDIRAWIKEGVWLSPMERKLIPTGLHISLPRGYEAQIRPRSGLALKKGLTLLNTPGTIDSDYRGEIKVLMINLSSERVEIKDGERIAQLILAQYTKIVWKEGSLDDSERGGGGFGSTGVR